MIMDPIPLMVLLAHKSRISGRWINQLADQEMSLPQQAKILAGPLTGIRTPALLLFTIQ